MTIPKELLFKRRRELPVLYSAEGAECGLVCMAMISRYYGHRIDLNGLRQMFPISHSGVNLRGLIKLADRLGFTTRPLRVELEALSDVKTPAVLHWNFNHFVVLKSVRRGHVIVHDPVRGQLTYSIAEASKFFTGVVLELEPAAGFKMVEARSPVKVNSLWSSLVGSTNGILLIAALSLALQLSTFMLPFQLQLVIDEGVERSDANILAVIAIGFAGLSILNAGLTAVRDWTVQLLGNQMVFQIVGNLLRHLLRLPSSYFEKRHIGDLLSRMNSTKVVQDALTHGIVSALLDGSMVIVAGIIIFAYSPGLAFVVVISTVLVAATSLLFYPIIRARTQEAIAAAADEQSHLMESLRAVTTIKLLGQEAEREANWRNLYSRSFSATVSVGRFQVTAEFLQNSIILLQTTIVLYLGALDIIGAKGLSIGMLIAFLSFRQTFSDSARSLINRGIQFRMLGLHLERLGDIISQRPEDDGGTVATPVIAGAIACNDTWFQYGATDPWVLQAVNMEIRAGDFIAITGPSGGGKSTLLKLLLGLQQPTSGEVVIDGRRPSTATWRAWRAATGVVSQEDRLLSGSVAENIAFFDTDMDMGRVEDAARLARIFDEISSMPMGFMTLIGDMGSSLSGGQRQRVLLARALYRNPKILILDEGTANLDIEAEEAIANLIASMDVTRIIVAHRPALIERADRVFHLEKGRLFETTDETNNGAHNRGDPYAK